MRNVFTLCKESVYVWEPELWLKLVIQGVGLATPVVHRPSVSLQTSRVYVNRKR